MEEVRESKIETHEKEIDIETIFTGKSQEVEQFAEKLEALRKQMSNRSSAEDTNFQVIELKKELVFTAQAPEVDLIYSEEFNRHELVCRDGSSNLVLKASRIINENVQESLSKEENSEFAETSDGSGPSDGSDAPAVDENKELREEVDSSVKEHQVNLEASQHAQSENQDVRNSSVLEKTEERQTGENPAAGEDNNFLGILLNFFASYLLNHIESPVIFGEITFKKYSLMKRSEI